MSSVHEKERKKEKEREKNTNLAARQYIIRSPHEHVKSFSGQQNVTVNMNAHDKAGI